MRGADDLDPLRRGKFVGRKNVSNLVVENFRGRARQRAQPVVAQHGKIIRQRHAREFHAIDNFHRGKRVDVHARHRLLDGAQNVAIIKLRQIARQAALNADFGRAQFPRLDRFARHVVERMKIRVRLARAAAEGAELASHKTDVGEIDVAVDDVGDNVAGKFGAQQIRGRQQAQQVVAFGIGQRVRFFQRQVAAVLRFQHFFQRTPQRRTHARGRCHDHSSEGKHSSSDGVSSRGMLFPVET